MMQVARTTTVPGTARVFPRTRPMSATAPDALRFQATPEGSAWPRPHRDPLPAGVYFPRYVPPTGSGISNQYVAFERIDTAGALLVRDLCPDRAMVTAGADRLEYGDTPQPFDYLMTEGRLSGVGQTSLELELGVYAKNKLPHDAAGGESPKGPGRMILKGYLTFALVGDKKTPVKALLQDPVLLRQFEIRRQNRKAEAAAIWQLAPERRAMQVEDHEVLPGTEAMYVTRATDQNIHQTVFGGTILDVLHQGALKGAQTFARMPLKLTHQDRMAFEEPGHIGEVLVAKPVVTRTWEGRRMEVQVDLVAYRPRPGASWVKAIPALYRRLLTNPRVIASSVYQFVPADPASRLPDWQPQTPKARLRAEAARIRDVFRQQEAVALAKG